jgi:hypothetical protein
MTCGLTENHYPIFSKSIVNEPENVSTDNEEPRFIHTMPTLLAAYNKKFIMGPTDIAIDDSIQRC